MFQGGVYLHVYEGTGSRANKISNEFIGYISGYDEDGDFFYLSGGDRCRNSLGTTTTTYTGKLYLQCAPQQSLFTFQKLYNTEETCYYAYLSYQNPNLCPKNNNKSLPPGYYALVVVVGALFGVLYWFVRWLQRIKIRNRVVHGVDPTLTLTTIHHSPTFRLPNEPTVDDFDRIGQYHHHHHLTTVDVEMAVASPVVDIIRDVPSNVPIVDTAVVTVPIYTAGNDQYYSMTGSSSTATATAPVPMPVAAAVYLHPNEDTNQWIAASTTSSNRYRYETRPNPSSIPMSDANLNVPPVVVAYASLESGSGSELAAAQTHYPTAAAVSIVSAHHR